MDRKAILGFTGSLIIGLGIYSPILTVPSVGSISYFVGSRGDGTFLILLAFVSLALTLKKKFNALWYPAVLSLAVTVFTFVTIYRRLSQAYRAFSLYSFSWGWLLLLLGIGFVIASAIIKDNQTNRT